ncbi:hypothetical protein [Streptomyces sp. NPDC002845]
MHSRMRRIPAIAFASTALVLGAVACTADQAKTGNTDKTDKADAVGEPGGKATQAAVRAEACKGGTFTWFNIDQSERLTGVAKAERVGKGGGKLTNRLQRVYTPEVSVKADGPSVPTREVLLSLGMETGVIDADEDIDSVSDMSFLDADQKAPELNDEPESVTLHAAAEFVRYAGVKVVEGDFHYSCPDGEITVGHARSWQVDTAGTAVCTEDPGPGLAVGRRAYEAVRFACDEDSVAAKAAAKALAEG